KPFSVEELRLRASNLIMITQAVKMMREELQTASGDLEELTTALMTSKTELRHTLEAVTIAREQAENASRLKSGFLGLLSHELRTPLTSMQLYAELLEHYHDQIPDEVVDVIERMQAAIKRMTDLVEGLLQQATIESGQLQVKLETIDVGPVIDEVAESVRPTAERKGLELAVNIDPDLPPVQTDRRLLRLIDSNLLVNAVKFTEKGSVEVRLELRGEAMRLSVIDTGPGIGPEDQVRIFQPFEQLEFIRRKHSAGVGLGLSLVREMVELLQGTIEVESTVRAGSTFLVCLPIISDNH
ncbi:MAG: sensor histidine kinase, partial [Bradymonadaceae bacterium]